MRHHSSPVLFTSVVYEMMDALRDRLLSLLPEELQQTETGRAKVEKVGGALFAGALALRCLPECD